VKFAGLNLFPRGEWVVCNHLPHLGRSPQNQLGAESKGFLKGVFKSLRESTQIALLAPKHHIPALHVGLRALQVH